MHIGATLRLLRMEGGFSLREMARRLGVSGAYLSRVEHGRDPVPTSPRLEAIARELELAPTLLMDAARRLDPEVLRYAEHAPQAVPLLLDIARRGLNARQLAQVRDFIATHFPRTEPEPASAAYALAPQLSPRRVVLRLGCAALADAWRIAASRFDLKGNTIGAREAASLLERRAQEIPPCIGAGVALAHLPLAGAAAQAVLVTIQPELALSTPDRRPLAVLIVLITPRPGGEALLRIAHVARLAARGLADSLRDVGSAEQALARVAALEALD